MGGDVQPVRPPGDGGVGRPEPQKDDDAQREQARIEAEQALSEERSRMARWTRMD